MPTFLYKGINTDGYIMSGAKKFNDNTDMENYLSSIGITEYQIYESKTDYKKTPYALVSTKELSIFCKQMSVLFLSHMTLLEGVSLLKEQMDNKQLKLALEEIQMYMEGGYTFGEAINMFDHIFTPYLLSMITIGEASGNLDNVFDRMSQYYDKEYKVRKKLRTALTYPLMLTLLMGAIVLLLIVKILPMFNDILMDMGSELPVATRVILGGGEFLAKYLWIMFLLILIAFVAGKIYFRKEKGAIFQDKLKTKLPYLRYITERVAASRISRSLAMLLKSGVPISNALEEVVPLIGNKYLEMKFKGAIDSFNNGNELVDAFTEVGIFPPLFIRMVTIGQDTGHLDEMMIKSADVFDDETDDAIDKVTTLVEPLLIIILSVIVGIILLSVMVPMINIMTFIG